MKSMNACELEQHTIRAYTRKRTYTGHQGTCDGHTSDSTTMLGNAQLKVWYNRIPKSGSTTMLMLLANLIKARPNCFRWIDSGNYLKNASASHKQIRKAMHETGWIDGDPPCNIEGHSIFTNHVLFTLLSNEQCSSTLRRRCRVARINLVRHPINRFVSAFHYRLHGIRTPEKQAADAKRYMAANGQVMSLQEHLEVTQQCPKLTLVPFFCGFVTEYPECKEPTQDAALRTAQRHVLEYYDVVGVLENLPSFMVALESKLPEIFSGLTAIAAGMSFHEKRTHSNVAQPLNAWSHTFLERCFRNDILLYAYIRDLIPNANKTGALQKRQDGGRHMPSMWRQHRSGKHRGGR